MDPGGMVLELISSLECFSRLVAIVSTLIRMNAAAMAAQCQVALELLRTNFA